MAFDGMVTPLGVKPEPRPEVETFPWRQGVVVFFSVTGAVLLGALAFGGGKDRSAAVVAQIERVSSAGLAPSPEPPAAAVKPAGVSPEAPAAPERHNTPGGGLVIKVPDKFPNSAPAPSDGLRHDAKVGERSDQGGLPVVGASEQRAYKLYARPFAATDRPKIAIVMTGVGVNARGTEITIRKLPGEVTLAFAPYGRDIETQVDDARLKGHEILLQVPMEPQDYPQSDPGPHTLRAADDKGENMARLRWLMSRFSGYVGITNFMGARLMRDAESYGALLSEFDRRGLLFLDDGSNDGALTKSIAQHLQLVSATADRVADNTGRVSLEQQLKDIEEIARKRGHAVITIPALPANIERVAAFVRGLAGRGVVLAPISAIMAGKVP